MWIHGDMDLIGSGNWFVAETETPCADNGSAELFIAK